jgi:hypothetical protein
MQDAWDRIQGKTPEQIAAEAARRAQENINTKLDEEERRRQWQEAGGNTPSEDKKRPPAKHNNNAPEYDGGPDRPLTDEDKDRAKRVIYTEEGRGHWGRETEVLLQKLESGQPLNAAEQARIQYLSDITRRADQESRRQWERERGSNSPDGFADIVRGLPTRTPSAVRGLQTVRPASVTAPPVSRETPASPGGSARRPIQVEGRAKSSSPGNLDIVDPPTRINPGAFTRTNTQRIDDSAIARTPTDRVDPGVFVKDTKK